MTTYSKQFYTKNNSQEEDLRHPDHLKTGTNWFGTSTYNRNFKMPNPEDYA